VGLADAQNMVLRLRVNQTQKRLRPIYQVEKPNHMGNYDTSAGVEQSSDRREGLPPWKRTLDLLCIFLISPAVVFVGLVVAIIIKLGSKGPIFFRQERVGYKGSVFTCFKFRTMRLNAETESHRLHTAELIKSRRPMIKLDAHQDPRLIPMGALLRAAGLDELPQLLNVVRGEMSLVGPRPCIPYEYEQYDPAHRRRFDAVPGLTGLWQVSGKNRTTFEQMIELDVEYSKRLSLLLDLQILARTIPALWGQYCDLRLAKSKTAVTSSPSLRKSAAPSRL
jgi:lipopolysaccharide/colanic/teichoic acid biosynthesis glycosyltransferase